MQYPRWKHHAKYGEKIVLSEEHLESLGEGWGEDSSVWRPHLVEKDHEEIETIGEAVPVEGSKPKRGRKNAIDKVSI